MRHPPPPQCPPPRLPPTPSPPQRPPLPPLPLPSLIIATSADGVLIFPLPLAPSAALTAPADFSKKRTRYPRPLPHPHPISLTSSQTNLTTISTIPPTSCPPPLRPPLRTTSDASSSASPLTTSLLLPGAPALPPLLQSLLSPLFLSQNRPSLVLFVKMSLLPPFRLVFSPAVTCITLIALCHGYLATIPVLFAGPPFLLHNQPLNCPHLHLLEQGHMYQFGSGRSWMK